MTLLNSANNLRDINIFSQYIVKREPRKAIVNKYIRLVNVLGVADSEDRYLKFVSAHPRTIPYVDSYLALTSPYSVLRYRLYIVFSVLESDKDYWQDFLPRKRSRLYIFYMFFVSLRSIYRLMVGALLASYIKMFK